MVRQIPSPISEKEQHSQTLMQLQHAIVADGTYRIGLRETDRSTAYFFLTEHADTFGVGIEPFNADWPQVDVCSLAARHSGEFSQERGKGFLRRARHGRVTVAGIPVLSQDGEREGRTGLRASG